MILLCAEPKKTRSVPNGRTPPMLIGMLGDRGHFAAGIVMVGAMLLVGAVRVGFLRQGSSEETGFSA